MVTKLVWELNFTCKTIFTKLFDQEINSLPVTEIHHLLLLPAPLFTVSHHYFVSSQRAQTTRPGFQAVFLDCLVATRNTSIFIFFIFYKILIDLLTVQVLEQDKKDLKISAIWGS